MKTARNAVLSSTLSAVIALIGARAAFADATEPDFERATYVVPVPRELVGAASLKLDVTRWDVRNGQRTLEYRMPAVLVGGKDLVVDLVAPESSIKTGFFEMTGNLATASCAASSRVTCFVRYERGKLFGPDFEQSKREGRDYLERTLGSDPKLEDRLAVFETFSTDPGGIVNLPLR